MSKEKAEKQFFLDTPFGKFIMNNKALVILILLCVVVSLISDVFLSPSNLLNVVRQVAYSVTLACGFTLILSSGNMDLSIGCEVGLVGVILGKLLVAGVPVALSVIICIISGAILSSINALVINSCNLPPFIVTLATMSTFKGLTYIVTKMVPISNLPAGFITLGQGYTLGIPNQVYIMFFMVILMTFILNKTKFGRYALAMGGNKEATRLSGINTNKVRLGVYAVMGVYVAVASVMLTARSASAQVSAGVNTEMDAIAAVVMGGTPMSGGSANVIGTLFGCLIVGVINNGLNLLGVDANWQLVAKGLMILFAIILDVLSSDMAQKISKKKMA